MCIRDRRNDDDLLPLSAGTRVALIGDLADTPRFQGSRCV